MLLYIKICYKEDKRSIAENCRLRQKYSICLLEEVVMLGYFADKAQVCRTMFCEFVPFLIALQHDYGCLQSTYCVLYFLQAFNIQIDLLHNILYNLY